MRRFASHPTAVDRVQSYAARRTGKECNEGGNNFDEGDESSSKEDRRQAHLKESLQQRKATDQSPLTVGGEAFDSAASAEAARRLFHSTCERSVERGKSGAP